jgi:hypothetical protein
VPIKAGGDSGFFFAYCLLFHAKASAVKTNHHPLYILASLQAKWFGLR